MAATGGGPTKVGTISWGTINSETYGMIQSINRGKGGQVKEYKDFQGDTKALVVYDKHDTVNISAIITGASPTIPDVGTKITLNLPDGNADIYVNSVSVDYSNEDATRISISGRTYPTLS